MFLLIPSIFAFFLVFLTADKKNNNNYLFYSLAFITALVSSLRVNVGRDYPIYESFFRGDLPVSGVDFSFILFSQGISILDPSGRLGFIITSFVIVFGYAIFFSKFNNQNRFLCFFLFLTIPIYFISSLNLIRQHLAISIVLMSLVFLFQNKVFRTFIFFVVGALLHRATLIYLILFSTNKSLERTLISILPLAIILVISIIFIYEGAIATILSYDYFAQHQSENSPYLLLFLAFACLFVSILIFFGKNIDHRNLIYWTNFFIFILLVVWYFSEFSNFWLRAAQFFFPFFIIGSVSVISLLAPVIIRYVVIFFMATILLTYNVLKYFQDPSYGFFTTL